MVFGKKICYHSSFSSVNCFCIAAFKIIFLFLVFTALIIVSWHRFLQVFGLLFAQLLESVGLCHLPHLRKVLAIIYFSEYFSSATISLFLLALKWHKCLSFVVIPQVPKALCFFNLHYLCCWLGNFCCCLQYHWFVLLSPPPCCWAYPLSLLKFQILHFSVVKFLFGFSLYLLFIFWCFLLFLHLFINVHWTLSSYNSIFILILASVDCSYSKRDVDDLWYNKWGFYWNLDSLGTVRHFSAERLLSGRVGNVNSVAFTDI